MKNPVKSEHVNQGLITSGLTTLGMVIVAAVTYGAFSGGQDVENKHNKEMQDKILSEVKSTNNKVEKVQEYVTEIRIKQATDSSMIQDSKKQINEQRSWLRSLRDRHEKLNNKVDGLHLGEGNR